MPSCKIDLKAACPLSEDYPRQLVTWGDHIRKKRLDLGLFQKDVAQLLQVNKDTICNWENNRTSPALCHFPRIIDFLGYVPYFGPCRSLGKMIMRYRETRGLSQKALANKIGVDPSTVERWEKGKGKPSMTHLLEIDSFCRLSCATAAKISMDSS